MVELRVFAFSIYDNLVTYFHSIQRIQVINYMGVA